MIVLPVHSKSISSLHFDPETGRLLIVFRDGGTHRIDRIDVTKVMRLVSNIPALRSTYFQTGN